MKILYDLDGVICEDIKEAPGTVDYERALQSATLLRTPNSAVDVIITGRTENYRETTEKWLKKHGIYNKLIMKPINLKGIENTPKYKSEKYLQENGAIYIESDSFQAEKIWQLSGKAVFCIENGVLYI